MVYGGKNGRRTGFKGDGLSDRLEMYRRCSRLNSTSNAYLTSMSISFVKFERWHGWKQEQPCALGLARLD